MVQFTPTGFKMNYIRQPGRIHSAELHPGGTYTTIDGAVLTGFQDCELPEHTHREIVDLAVFLATDASDSPARQARAEKLNMVN